MLAMGQGAALAAFKPQSHRMIHGYAAHLRSRAAASERKRAVDFERYVPGTFAATPDGTIAIGRGDELWGLWLDWVNDYGQRQLAVGTWEEVERYALEVITHGPPGGPDLRKQGSKWRDISGDGTLHSLTLGGEYRLMPLYGGGHVLALSRNDGPLRVLGIGNADVLQRAPDARRSNDVLHVTIGGERVELRSACAAGVLGFLDWYGGYRLLLGHFDGEHFGLCLVRGAEGRCLRVYDFEAVCRGDLGEVLALLQQAPGERSLDEGGIVGGDAGRPAEAPRAPVPAQVEPAPRTQVTTPKPAAARPAAARPAAARPAPARSAPRRTAFSPDERRRIEDYWTATEPRPATGPGASQVPKVFKGLRARALLGLPTQLLRNCDLRDMLEGIDLEDGQGLEFHCCTKTFGRAVAAVARQTSMLEPVGKRWRLLGGRDLLDLLDQLTAGEDEPAGPVLPAMDPPFVANPASSTPHPAPPPSSPPHTAPAASSTPHPAPAASSPPHTAPAASSTPHPAPAASSTPHTPPSASFRDHRPESSASSTVRREPLASQASASSVPAPRQPAPIEGRLAPTPDLPDVLDQVPRAGDKERRPTLEEVLARPYIYEWHGPEIMRVSRASVPDNVSASRFVGRKPRDGPK